MKLAETHHSENRRYHVFRIFYSILFLTFFTFLTKLQIIESEDFEDQERKQGQRRILHPGARGDVFDRDGKLLIGNKAQFSAVIHLDKLKNEIWEKKVFLKKTAFEIRNELLNIEELDISKLLHFCFQENHVKKRFILLSGQKNKGSLSNSRIYWQNKRLTVIEEKNGKWSCEVQFCNNELDKIFRTENVGDKININVAVLFSTCFYSHFGKKYLPYPSIQNKDQRNNDNLFSTIFQSKNPDLDLLPEFRTSSITLSWEARYSVVTSYLKKVNLLCTRNEELPLNKFKNHWNRRLVLPMKLVPNLSSSEYAAIIEDFSPNSAVQIQVESVRHYPQNSLASHVLGYVGS